MKRISLSLVLLAFAGLAWWYLKGPVGAVEYHFEETLTGNFKARVQPVRFALISDIHLRESSREEITDERGTRDILDQFLTSMNDEVKPDFIVQLGDLADGCLEDCRVSASESQIVDRLKRARQYTQSKTDIPWFDVIGNHEYKSGYNDDQGQIAGRDFSAIYQAIDENWSKLEDTWYFRDIKGYRFIFLNTAFPQPGASHLIPLAQIDWLKGVLASSDAPAFVFMHVSLSPGTGGEYDRAINREMVSSLLAGDDSFVLGFFGHSHHADAWDGLRRQFDGEGNVYFHVPAPHEWMGDRSGHPWIIVEIDPDTNVIRVEVGSGVRRSELMEFAYYLGERSSSYAARLIGD